MPPTSVTHENLGAWLVKASPGGGTVEELARRGWSTDWSSCLRPGRRADLVEPGQRVLLWVSGRDRVTPAGIHAHGVTTGPAVHDEEGAAVPLRLEPVDPPVLRTDLLAHPVLAGIEVIRMPAGSNPSYLTHEQLSELEEGWPQLQR